MTLFAKPKAPSGRSAWSKFYWADWDTDPALALCSMAAQGFWMRLLCLATKADGYVKIGGKRATSEQLATFTRQTVADVDLWVTELVDNGVCSLTQGRVIYSRRMREDRENYERNRENGLLGGNPKLKPSKDLEPEKPPPDDGGLKAEAEAEAEAIPPEGAQSAQPPLSREPNKEAWDRAVDLLTRDGKAKPPAARTYFGRLLRDHALDPRDMLPAIVRAETIGTPDARAYLVAAARALAQRRPSGPPAANAHAWTDDQWKVAVQLWRDGEGWGETMGPEPGEAGCRVPVHLLVIAADAIATRALA